ncbi:hypothetical protein NPIL_649101 [Nephila pilipes]|uniref:Uncharacterized protein n=1 Tax=Nephila pilipes TaxID=299642 RepID=A0A8X6NRI2_NEPPI|nr:hypothetical protein NPIL_649101 [Nephila pilipes]
MEFFRCQIEGNNSIFDVTYSPIVLLSQIMPEIFLPKSESGKNIYFPICFYFGFRSSLPPYPSLSHIRTKNTSVLLFWKGQLHSCRSFLEKRTTNKPRTRARCNLLKKEREEIGTQTVFLVLGSSSNAPVPQRFSFSTLFGSSSDRKIYLGSIFPTAGTMLGLYHSEGLDCRGIFNK